jgi:hypothetical protein
MLEDKPLKDITLDDVQEIVDSKVPEGQKVDYKRLYELGNDKGKAELVADVCSFANAFGGHLIIGVNDVDGMPSGIVGVECTDTETEINRMRDFIRHWSEPTLGFLAFSFSRPIPVSPGRFVFVIRVEPSPNGPHSVCVRTVREFFVRHASGKVPMETSELRDAFVASESSFNRMRLFRKKRVKKHIASGQTPVVIGDGAKCILHLFPYASFRRGMAYDVRTIKQLSNWFTPLAVSALDVGIESRVNLDGFVAYRLAINQKPTNGRFRSRAYLQVYRNGIIEGVNGDIIDTSSDISINASFDELIEMPSPVRNDLRVSDCEIMLIRGVRSYWNGLKALGVTLPIWCYVAFTGMRGVSLSHSHLIDRDVLLLPETEISTDVDDPGPLLKPICDALWNSAGYENSKTFEQNLALVPLVPQVESLFKPS